MAVDTEEEDKGFKVHDRRRFASDSGESPDHPEEAPPQAVQNQPSVELPIGEDKSASNDVPPAINFSTFIISLSTQALMHLGEIPNPLTGKMDKEVNVAKQTIDILSLLHEKTRGNLDPEEAKLLNEILFNLRMNYVEAVRNK